VQTQARGYREAMDVGPVELLIVLAVVLLLFGSKKLPELAKGMGQAAKEFRSGLHDESDDKPDEKTSDEKPDTPAVAAAPADQKPDPSSN
jgi:sec-independent protein translocase protein TatA